MKYATMTPAEITARFATDVLGWILDKYGDWRTSDGVGFVGYRHLENDSSQDFPIFEPLKKENLFHAMMGVEKLRKKYTVEIVGENNWMIWLHTIDDTAVICYDDNLNHAIVEACLRITTPSLFEEE